MIQGVVDPHYCGKCVFYRCSVNACSYMLVMDIRRGCPAGVGCDKRMTKKEWIALGIPKAWDKDLGKRLFLQGHGDCEIAKACGVAQGTISYYRKKHWEMDVVEGGGPCDREAGADLDMHDDLAVSACSPHPVGLLPEPAEEREVTAGDGGENLGGNHMCNYKNNLQDTTALMCSEDYKERFVAEYRQTKIRYEKLKAFNTKIEAAQLMRCWKFEGATMEEPKHDCPENLLRDQQRIMGEYLRILELRAVIEGIDLCG